VFTPTNDAFENLPDGTVETLLKPENREPAIFANRHTVDPEDYRRIRALIIQDKSYKPFTDQSLIEIITSL